MKIETPYSIVLFDDSLEAKQRVFDIALKWFKKLDNYSGESLAQSDSTYEFAPEILAEIAEDGFKFKEKWKDEYDGR